MKTTKISADDATFDGFDNGLGIIDKIRDGETSLTDVKINQERFKFYLGEIKKQNNKWRSKEPKKNALYNIEMLYKARSKAMTIVLQWSLKQKQKLKQLKEQKLKY